MADKAFITPKVLKWARESARFTLESAAAKVPVSIDRLKEWEDENGTDKPTIKQAEKLAKTYKRPFALFFLPEIPRDFQPLQDFRIKSAKPFGTGSVFIMREIQQKQAWMSEVMQENNEKPLPFVGQFSIKDNPVKVAAHILETLQINPAAYTSENQIKVWIDRAETNGIFISRTSFIHSRLTLDSDEMQGFSIADKFAPFVFVNSHDWNAPQLFTLVHELAHIWIGTSGVSNQIEHDLKHKDKLDPVELFCNEVAANALMPTQLINSNSNAFNSSKEVYQLAKALGVSSFALLVRGLNLNILSIAAYNKLKADADKDFKEYELREEAKKAKQKEKEGGGPNPYLLRLNKNGRLFTQIVLDAFRGGNIEATIASNLLNTQVNNFSKLEAFIYL